MDEQTLMSFSMEIHSDNPREGPGRRASTTRAMQFLTEPPSRSRILDIGCGPGMQTIDANLTVIEGSGFQLIDHFILPIWNWRRWRCFGNTLMYAGMFSIRCAGPSPAVRKWNPAIN